MARIEKLSNEKPDIRKQLHLKTITNFACKTGGVHIRMELAESGKIKIPWMKLLSKMILIKRVIIRASPIQWINYFRNKVVEA